MSDAHFTLYHYPLTRSTRVKWLLHDIFGDEFDNRVPLEKVVVRRGEQFRPEYLAVNPNHAVPVLRVDTGRDPGYSIFESGAMLAWLADVFPERGLAPPAHALSVERADYLQMLHFGSSSVDMMLWQLRLHLGLLPADQRDVATVARYRSKFTTEVEPQLSARLAATPWICGQRFSAADCVTGHNIGWARNYGLAQGPVFDDYLARLAERPAFAAAYSDRDQFGAD